MPGSRSGKDILARIALGIKWADSYDPPKNIQADGEALDPVGRLPPSRFQLGKGLVNAPKQPWRILLQNYGDESVHELLDRHPPSRRESTLRSTLESGSRRFTHRSSFSVNSG